MCSYEYIIPAKNKRLLIVVLRILTVTIHAFTIKEVNPFDYVSYFFVVLNWGMAGIGQDRDSLGLYSKP